MMMLSILIAFFIDDNNHVNYKTKKKGPSIPPNPADVPCALNNTYLPYRPDCSNTAIQQQGYTFEDVFDVAPDSDSDLLGQDMDVTC